MDSRPSILMELDGLLLQEASLVAVVAEIRLGASSPNDQVNPLPGPAFGEFLLYYIFTRTNV